MIKLGAAERLAASKFETFAMSNLKSDFTGLPNSIYIWFDIGGDHIAHGPRIKVSNIRGKFRKDDTFSVSIPTTPNGEPGTCAGGDPKNFTAKEMRAIYDWVKLNRQALLTIWRSDDMDDDEARKLLRRLGN